MKSRSLTKKILFVIVFFFTLKDCLAGEKALFMAAHSGDAQKIEELCSQGVSPNILDEEKRSVLHIIAAKNYSDACKILLKYDVEIDECSLGSTPLHIAAGAGALEIVKLLINSDADIYKESDQGTPLEYALALNHVSVVSYLASLVSDEW